LRGSNKVPLLPLPTLRRPARPSLFAQFRHTGRISPGQRSGRRSNVLPLPPPEGTRTFCSAPDAPGSENDLRVHRPKMPFRGPGYWPNVAGAGRTYRARIASHLAVAQDRVVFVRSIEPTWPAVGHTSSHPFACSCCGDGSSSSPRARVEGPLCWSCRIQISSRISRLRIPRWHLPPLAVIDRR
jgi:hypothetical protein